jgi:hypothetical protein
LESTNPNQIILKSCGLILSRKQRSDLNLEAKFKHLKKIVHTFPKAKKFDNTMMPCCIPQPRPNLVKIDDSFNCTMLNSISYGSKLVVATI